MQPSHVWSRTGALLGIVVVIGALAIGTGYVAAQPSRPGSDRLEPGVLAPQGEPDYGVIRWETRLEYGVLVPSDDLESGLLGQDDPLFARPAPTPACRGRCRDLLEPGVLGPQNELEPGLIGQSDPLFR
jgi:hypothetical protein